MVLRGFILQLANCKVEMAWQKGIRKAAAYPMAAREKVGAVEGEVPATAHSHGSGTLFHGRYSPKCPFGCERISV